MIASSQIFEFITAPYYSISMRLFMGIPERRVNVREQISAFQPPLPPPLPQKGLSKTGSAEALKSFTLTSNDSEFANLLPKRSA